jgi:hypothetical protein
MLINQSNQKKSIEIKDLDFLEAVSEQDASKISGGDHPGMAPEGAYEEGVMYIENLVDSLGLGR